MRDYVAVDIGASSGRLVRGTLQDGRLALQEIHRFENGFSERDGHCYWDIDHLYREILRGLQQAKKLGIERCTLGIDTWAVDYALLDEKGERIGEVYAYRDSRTLEAVPQVHAAYPFARIYEITGIQQLTFNTLYQLYAHDPKELAAAKEVLLVPDYLYYLLSGRKMNELTNASTTALLNLQTRDYDPDLLGLLGLSRSKFPALTEPGTRLGSIRPELVREFGLPECELIVAATHDTASAVLGVPASGASWAYLSSGTWSLIGVERQTPLATPEAMERNYTNEWGAYGTYRFLKNIMGMWLIQEVRKDYGKQHSYAELVELAEAVPPFRSLMNCNDDRFLNPAQMTEEIRRFCVETGQPVPDTPGAVARCIFDSLALSYDVYLQELERLTGQKPETLHIVGGGANNGLLCQWTADVAGIPVEAGPTESTALGNLLVQMISSGAIRDIGEGRELIRRSFSIRTYVPRGTNADQIAEARRRFADLLTR
ncbi:MAG: rhamnulokinase [Paenibacillus sp.]|uniref:rhamnulokinase n=1 Tax=Paenibacillus sp. TaxID=58172 RepID=UPI00290D09DB|nr:rhamnulokinase [Paenibacillus sp.]MDU4696142.1 rhamnulokinase [Paenibacillus sp.]